MSNEMNIIEISDAQYIFLLVVSVAFFLVGIAGTFFSLIGGALGFFELRVWMWVFPAAMIFIIPILILSMYRRATEKYREE